MLAAFENLLAHAKEKRSVHIFVINLRILLAFAFLPAGLKKFLHQPFTDPSNTGVFHDFLHAFHASGVFYQFVGVMQLTAAVLLFSQRFASIGIILLMPILTSILVFCWSTLVIPTATIVTLMFLGGLFLVFWDLHKWKSVFYRDGDNLSFQLPEVHPTIHMNLWTGCGLSILGLYLLVCALSGEIYRPRGLELDNPNFYLFPIIASLPILTFIADKKIGPRDQAP